MPGPGEAAADVPTDTNLGGWFMLIPYDAMRSRVLEGGELGADA